jgi:hypothetical protein
MVEMTKAQLKYFAQKAVEYRRRHPKRAREVSRDWKARNPDWWKGRKYVQLLTSALVNGNAKSKVFADAGTSMNEWVKQASDSVDIFQVNGHTKLVPIKSWREFNLSDPSQVKAFLAPGNFRLVSK